MLHSNFNSLKSGLFHLTAQPNSQVLKAKVRDGMISEAVFLVVCDPSVNEL